MSDLKDDFRDWRKRKQAARARMVTCDYCGQFDGYKVWPNEPCPRCNEVTIGQKKAEEKP